MSSKTAMARSVSRVGFWTFASRIFGLIRDSVSARLFGVGFVTDAFMIAFMLPNLLRRLLAEGALSIAFIPTFSQIYTQRSREEFQQSFRIVFTVFSTVLMIVSILGVVLSPMLVHIFAPGFDSDKTQLTILLTQWMFPFIFFMGSASVCVAILNTLKSFSVPAAAPLILNLVIIICSVTLYRYFKVPIFSLAIGVLLGGFIQWILHIWVVARLGFSITPAWDWNHPVLKRMFLLMGPMVFGVAVYHLNILVSRALASLLPQGSVTYLFYSDRFLEFPLGIFAISIATVALPQLAEEASKKDFEKLKDTLYFSLRLATFICLPAMMGLVVLRVPILSLVFHYGKFTFQNTMELAQVFLMASLGLCAIAGLRITVQVFYSLGEVKVPVRAAFANFILNASLGFALMKFMGTSGLTLASSLAAWLQWVILVYYLNRRLGKLPIRRFFYELIPVLLSTLVMSAAIYPFGFFQDWFIHRPLWLRFGYVFGAIILGITIYTGSAYLFGVKEIRFLIRKFRERIWGSGAIEV